MLHASGQSGIMIVARVPRLLVLRPRRQRAADIQRFSIGTPQPHHVCSTVLNSSLLMQLYPCVPTNRPLCPSLQTFHPLLSQSLDNAANFLRPLATIAYAFPPRFRISLIRRLAASQPTLSCSPRPYMVQRKPRPYPIKRIT